ncbi:hypothetical protein SAMN02745126_05754 [Enhydrobacter aerosaccus]|uniref:Secreted protein n=1 Tax=Enhydrobacter aerosaccus TaxID=225324 RepID=A0A1T4T603_9HYPH|nr:hypothetical protein [Enhydrobacter aerosaccus]SKA35970.1 hypothetical protein SAMN02745126_05754 [Enhydrobacter aerosaccus]
MTTRFACLASIAAITLLMPVAVNAQANAASPRAGASDPKYCETLAQRYAAQHPIMEGSNASTATAMNDCQSDPQGSTATLMHAMQDEKIAIPPRP